MVTKNLPLLRLMVMGAIVSLLAGCATMRYGGAPEPTSNLNTDIDELSQQFKESTSITNFYKNPSQKARDEFIVGRLTLMNLRYLKFIRNLTSERQLLDSATAITAIGLGLAGSMVPLALTTKILAAVSAGVAGTKEVIDKNYYFEKTIPALVAQMNAERQKALIPILEGMQKDILQYRFEKAVVDLDNYYIAGTFAGAIQSIQTDAGKKENEAKEEIKQLTPATPAQIVKKQELTDSLTNLANTPENLIKIKTAIVAIAILKKDSMATPKEDFDGAKKQLQDYIRDMNKEDLNKFSDVFKKAGILP